MVRRSKRRKPSVTPSAAAWVKEWLAGSTASTTAKTGKHYRQVAGNFLSSLGDRATRSVTEIAPRDIQQYRAQKGASSSPSTAEQGLKIVRSIFKAAVLHGLITSNPCDAIEPLPVGLKLRGVFTRQEVASLVAVADADWKGAILFGYYTGARLGDLIAVDWDSIDSTAGIVTFHTKKNRRTVAVPLHPALQRYLSMRYRSANEATSCFVFPALAGQGSGGKNGLSSQFQTIMIRAGISGQDTTRGVNPRRTFRSLRHGFALAIANAAVSLAGDADLTASAPIAVDRDAEAARTVQILRAAIATLPTISPEGTGG